MNGLKHKNIVGLKAYGPNGYVVKPSGRKIENLVYIIMEYAEGGILFDVCDKMKGMGEDVGREFFKQMVETLEYMHSKGVVHRDIKLENLLVDCQLNLKFADFGYSTYKNIENLQDYYGTKTYIAPEVREGQYNGKKIDIFSSAVVLFIIVKGQFPFVESKDDDFYYQLIKNKNFNKYWQ